MSLSPVAFPFFSCSSPFNLRKRTDFLDKASMSLSPFDFNLFSDILSEWESCVLLDRCFSWWRKFIPNEEIFHLSSLHILSFNVRGFNLRWHEVVLLSTSLKSDIVILLETGNVDLSFCEKVFNPFKIFYQKGENRNGGVLILVRHGIHVSRVECKLSNVCVIDIIGDGVLRLVGVYAPLSKSWTCDDLSSFLSRKCVVFGDFNVDLDQDGNKADEFLKWTDNNFAAYTPEESTSLRSDRVIDFALARGISLSIQTHSGKVGQTHFVGANDQWNIDD